MANPFLNNDCRDVETAIMLEQAMVHDIGNAVAYTDGDRIFLNTQDNLFKILPAYDDNMLKWLLWHERMHLELRHHNRFFKYLEELSAEDTEDEFQVTKSEVNIIMDILVHDSLAKMFPELVETAVNNFAQMRNRNSLGYTFKATTLEEMLDEYKAHKHPDDPTEPPTEPPTGEPTEPPTEPPTGSTPTGEPTEPPTEPPTGEPPTGSTPGHSHGGGPSETKHTEDETEPETSKGTPPKSEPEPEHDKTDWSKLDDINPKEFIDADEANHIDNAIKELKNKKLKLAKVTETLNGLVTTERIRTYARPSYIGVDKGIMLKGRKRGKASLYLVFDASGSMGGELALFKKIISESIPQAMSIPTEWFSGCYAKIPRNPEGRNHDYYKGTFKDIMPVWASGGYNDDGDRVIELCLAAEKQGYSPIGVTDGGGGIYEPEVLKQLKRTVLVGNSKTWLRKAKEINPRIETIDI